MPAGESHRAPEKLGRLGAEAFDRHVRATLRPEDDDKFVTIDIVSGDYGSCGCAPAGRLPTSGWRASGSQRRTA
jgi:hypothetical protein